jgi:toxic protein SymE
MAAVGCREQGAPTAKERSRKSRRLKMGYVPTSKSAVDLPCLRLRGQWLEEAGFAIGQNLRVEVNERKLMIEVVD